MPSCSHVSFSCTATDCCRSQWGRRIKRVHSWQRQRRRRRRRRSRRTPSGSDDQTESLRWHKTQAAQPVRLLSACASPGPHEILWADGGSSRSVPDELVIIHDLFMPLSIPNGKEFHSSLFHSSSQDPRIIYSSPQPHRLPLSPVTERAPSAHAWLMFHRPRSGSL